MAAKKVQKKKDEKRPLTPEQRVFCRLVAVENVKAGQAYKQAFNCKAASAYTLASRLLKKVEIQTEINRLSTPIERVKEKARIWTKAERMEYLQEWAQASVEKDDIPTAIKCVDTLNKMDGAYETKREPEAERGGLYRVMPADAQNTAAHILQKLKEAHERRLASGEHSSIRL